MTVTVSPPAPSAVISERPQHYPILCQTIKPAPASATHSLVLLMALSRWISGQNVSCVSKFELRHNRWKVFFSPSLLLISYYKCFKVTEQVVWNGSILECQLELGQYNGHFIAVIMVMKPVQ